MLIEIETRTVLTFPAPLVQLSFARLVCHAELEPLSEQSQAAACLPKEIAQDMEQNGRCRSDAQTARRDAFILPST